MFPKKFQPKRLAQLIVANVARHLANFMLANGEFESPALEELFYVDNFTNDAIHKFGEASLTFPHNIFLEKNKRIVSSLTLKHSTKKDWKININRICI